MIGMPTHREPITGQAAKDMLFHINAIKHYKEGIASKEEIDHINKLKKRDELNLQRIKNYNITWDNSYID